MDFIRTLGDTVKKARKRLGLTQLKAAEICSIDSRTILNIENYRGNPKMGPGVKSCVSEIRQSQEGMR